MIDERLDAIYVALPKKPECWTLTDVTTWLQLIGMEKYVDVFRRLSLILGDNSVDGLIIFELCSEEIIEKELNISQKLHRRKIVNGKSFE